MSLRKLLLGGLLGVVGLSPAMASPAQSLFDQATFFIGFYYNGPAKVPNFRELRQRYQGQLEQACRGLGEQCGYEQARGVILRIIEDLGDPFTTLLSAEEEQEASRLGAGLGPVAPWIGVWVRPGTGGLVVVESFPGEAAYRAGLRRGDVITQVGGQMATPQALRAAERSQQPFTLSYSRQGQIQRVEVRGSLSRESLQPRLELQGGVAYLRVYHLYYSERFSVAERVHQLVRQAEQEGARGIVLDLRDSLTGIDDEALLAANAFLPKAGFVYDWRFKNLDDTFSAEGGKVYVQGEGETERVAVREVANPVQSSLPLVVLVNRNTFNSAEMLAYFLQAAGRAKVVGEASAGALGVSGNADNALINGEFLAVSSIRMKNLDGSPFPLKLTPDVVVSDDLEALAQGRDVVLEKAREVLGIGNR
ncbi:S41 family peptidase [Calidithermus roseus]|uniref:Putative CtpA-like serine protease n=1 Tax=Calidithermus roseus TaxID=1644118 RepID=A0A399ENI6_9DEIN|nr:S41 family peptidase [Calidithermus roseus]RIH85020.1 putative CtpA-like serine protease [Calidithermus roseus]